MPIPVAIGAALAGAAASGIGTIYQNWANKRAQQRAFEQNKQFWHERFDKEARYSSPVQQMARYKAAGLNPALMYGGGAGSSGNVSGPSAQGKVAEKYDLANLAMMSAQTAKIVQDAKRSKAEAEFVEAKTEGQGTTNKIAVQQLGIKQIENLNASEKMKLSLKNDLMDVLNKVESYNMKVEQTEYWEGKKEEQQNINYEWNKLQKQLIDQGVDRDAPMFQSIKQYIMSRWSGWTQGMSWDNFWDPTTNIYGEKAEWSK